MPLFIALVHYPTVNKLGKVVATSVTNFDIHDIARASRTYGVAHYFMVTPIAMQRDFVERIMRHWLEGEGAEYNPTRGDALQIASVATDLAAVGEIIARDFGSAPLWVATSARVTAWSLTARQLRSKLDEGQNVCLIFGTGHGLHQEIMELADAILEPIHGPTNFNHLSVRSAVSIYLDRLLGKRSDG